MNLFNAKHAKYVLKIQTSFYYMLSIILVFVVSNVCYVINFIEDTRHTTDSARTTDMLTASTETMLISSKKQRTIVPKGD